LQEVSAAAKTISTGMRILSDRIKKCKINGIYPKMALKIVFSKNRLLTIL
jgi:hypothetical protein